jgi:tRNA(fMet)-specific endonuclease VapC
MSFLLDTNVCSQLLRRPGPLTHRFQQHSGNLSLSSIALAELYTWAYRRPDTVRMLTLIERDILPECRVVDFDRACASRFGVLRGPLLNAGVTVHPVDLMIAAVAIEHDLTLVTHNVKHFELVPGLRIADWLS